MTSSGPASTELQIPFSHVATFIRQLTHDVRNNLNAMDLQAAFAVELITDPEAAEEVRRIRQLIQQATKHLQGLSANFQQPQPNLVEYSAKIFVEDLQDRLKKLFPDQADAVKWKSDLGEEEISVDLEMVFTAIAEVFRNAFQFRDPDATIEIEVSSRGDSVDLRVIEPKAAVPSSPETWGVEPFVTTRRGGYGLGLFRAKRFLEKQGASHSATYDSAGARLVTTISLPLATAKA
jgi:K+-sensing histidine kinase KdpD